HVVNFFWFIMGLEQETNIRRDCASMHPESPVSNHSDECVSMQKFLRDAEKECRNLGLNFAVKHLNRMLRDVRAGDVTFNDLVIAYEELVNRISDEFEDCLFFGVNKERIEFYSDAPGRFGTDTLDKFPSCRMEVEEAGKCYALGRY